MMEKTHPLAPFRHCPVCGSAHFAPHDTRSKHCADCGFTYYANASAATAALILDRAGDRLLAVRRRCDPARGTLDLPGGFVDPGETLEQGMCRELAEEIGAQVTTLTYLFSLPNVYRFSGMDIHTTDAFFACQIADETAVSAHDDAEDVLWLPLDRVDAELFGLDSVRRAVRRYLDTL